MIENKIQGKEIVKLFPILKGKKDAMKIKLIQNKKREITLICVTIMVMILFFSGCSIGKAISSTQIKSNGAVAKPILVVENNPEINITSKQKEGNYTFYVKNYNEVGEITQVDMKYYVQILNKEDDAISIKLLKNNKEISIENNQTEEFTLKKKEMQQDEYKIQIKYDKEKSTSIEDIMQKIEIKVHSEQAKG